MSNENEQKEKLLKLMAEAISRDKELRDQFQIGDKFRFIRDRLHSLQVQIQENVTMQLKKEEETKKSIMPDESLVFVYLYNAQGLVFTTWQKMVNPTVFYEYSVNRPIYAEKSLVESLIKNKANKAQHAYLTMAVKSEHIATHSLKDPVGNPLIKVKEGALLVDKMLSFTHNDIDYVLNEKGELVKKPGL